MHRSLPRLLLLSLILVLIPTCKSSTEPSTPTSVAVSSSKTTLVTLGETTQVSASVKDQKGKTMSGQSITWSSSNVSVATVSTGGLVTAVANGTATIRATSGGINGSVAITVAQVAATLEKVAGDDQTGPAGINLPVPLRVRALDAGGNPVVGMSVTFAVTAGGGSPGSPSAGTNSSGEASSPWQLGTDASAAQRMSASAGSASVEFSATAQAGPAALVEVASGDAQSADALAPLAQPIVGTVTDQFGNSVSGAAVTWAAAENNGVVTAVEAQSASDGSVSANWTLGPVVGQQTATVSIDGTTGSTDFQATGQVPVLEEIQVSPGNASVLEGAEVQLSGKAFAAGGIEVQGVPFSWTSSTPSVVSVSEGGLATGLSPGFVTLTASAGGADGTASLLVYADGAQPGLSIQLPASASVGDTITVTIRMNTGTVPHLVGALDMLISWDPSILSAPGWTADAGGRFWAGLLWGDRMSIAVSAPTGVTGQLDYVTFKLVVNGGAGTQTPIDISLGQAIAAQTYLDFSGLFGATGAQLTINP